MATQGQGELSLSLLAAILNTERLGQCVYDSE